MNKNLIITGLTIIIVAFLVWRGLYGASPSPSFSAYESADPSEWEQISRLKIPYYYFDYAYDGARCESRDCILLDSIPRKYDKESEYTIITKGEVAYVDATRNYENHKRALSFTCLFDNTGMGLPVCEAQELLFQVIKSENGSDAITLINWPTVEALAGRPRPLHVVSISPYSLIARKYTEGDRSGMEYRLDRRNGTLKIIDFWYEGDGDETVYHYVGESEQRLVQ